jgi:hypothetical protein
MKMAQATNKPLIAVLVHGGIVELARCAWFANLFA